MLSAGSSLRPCWRGRRRAGREGEGPGGFLGTELSVLSAARTPGPNPSNHIEADLPTSDPALCRPRHLSVSPFTAERSGCCSPAPPTHTEVLPFCSGLLLPVTQWAWPRPSCLSGGPAPPLCSPTRWARLPQASRPSPKLIPLPLTPGGRWPRAACATWRQGYSCGGFVPEPVCPAFCSTGLSPPAGAGTAGGPSRRWRGAAVPTRCPRAEASLRPSVLCVERCPRGAGEGVRGEQETRACGGRALLSGGECRRAPGGERGPGQEASHGRASQSVSRCICGGRGSPGGCPCGLGGHCTQPGGPAPWPSAGRSPACLGPPATRSLPAFLLQGPVPLGSGPGPVHLGSPRGNLRRAHGPATPVDLCSVALASSCSIVGSPLLALLPLSLNGCSASACPSGPGLPRDPGEQGPPPAPRRTAASPARSPTRVGCHVNFPLTHSPI